MTYPTLGRQLSAARVLAGFDRSSLALAAGLSFPTVRRLEQLDRVSALSTTLDKIERALLTRGVEFTNEAGALGVRLATPGRRP